VLTAQPEGTQLAACLRKLATGKDSSRVVTTAERWAAVRCLPHACKVASQVCCTSRRHQTPSTSNTSSSSVCCWDWPLCPGVRLHLFLVGLHQYSSTVHVPSLWRTGSCLARAMFVFLLVSVRCCAQVLAVCDDIISMDAMPDNGPDTAVCLRAEVIGRPQAVACSSRVPQWYQCCGTKKQAFSSKGMVPEYLSKCICLARALQAEHVQRQTACTEGSCCGVTIRRWSSKCARWPSTPLSSCPG
jgi:hypothetical protein